jgi:hypothetical protein
MNGTVYAALWVWRAGALVVFLGFAVMALDVVSHILRQPPRTRHRSRPAR